MTELDLMTVEEVAQYLRLKPQTIYKWAQEKRIPAVKLGKEWRFRKRILDEWLDSQILPNREGQADSEQNLASSRSEGNESADESA
jgi:excisionase family DNA binding protein